MQGRVNINTVVKNYSLKLILEMQEQINMIEIKNCI